MIALATSSLQRDPIRLTDTECETCGIVGAALDIVYNVEFDYSSDRYDCYNVSFIIDFANKWEISMISNLIQKDFFMDAKSKGGPTYPSDCFLIALKLRNNELVRTSLDHGEKAGWYLKDTSTSREILKDDSWKYVSSRYLGEESQPFTVKRLIIRRQSKPGIFTGHDVTHRLSSCTAYSGLDRPACPSSRREDSDIKE